MLPTGRLVQHVAGLVCLTACFSLAAPAQELSHARIVRLSFAEGVVTIHRPDVDTWSSASVNTPIQEGFKVATDQGGFAEIEFENASTARIGQGTLLEFTQLALLPSGGKVNRMTVLQGYATFSVIPEDDDIYEVTVGTSTLIPRGKTLFRVDLEDSMLQVKVFKGSVEITSPEGNGTLGKDSVVEIRPGEEQPFEISYGITKDSWDKWVEDREERTEMVRSMGAPGLLTGYSNNVNDLLWGAMDLMYFGSWISNPIYGYGWVPAVGPGWSPYTHGRWCWYPGYGYTWISYEPWGWIPYHYGEWTYNAGIGWCWFPRGGFGTWSPARVHWYQGNGWVGWSPRVTSGGIDARCPHREGCIATVPDSSLTDGRTVQPAEVQWRSAFQSGRPIDRVNLDPGPNAMLPGTTVAFSPRVRGTSAEQGSPGSTNIEGISVIGGVRGGESISDSSGVVYDPATGTYINHSAGPRTPQAPEATDASRGFARGSSTGVARPAPANNYPAVPQAWGSQRGAAPPSNAATSGSSSDDSEWIRSTAVGWGDTRSDSSSGGGRSSTSGGSAASSSRGSSGTVSPGVSSGGRPSSSSGGWGGGGAVGGSRGGSPSGSSGGGGGGGRGSIGGGAGSSGGSRGSIGGGGGAGRSSGGAGGGRTTR